MAMIFQDPMTSLNPVLTIGVQISEALLAHNDGMNDDAARKRTVELLELVGVPYAGAARGAVPARVLRRHAPARDDRDGDRERPERPRRGRADDRARRDDPGADRRGAEDRAAGDARGDHPHHARPRARRGARRPRRRHVRRPRGRARRRVHDLQLTPAPVHGRAHEQPRAPGHGPAAAGADPRPAAEPPEPPARVRVPPAVHALAGPGDLPDGRAAAAANRGRRAPLRVPLRRGARSASHAGAGVRA